MCLFQHEDYDDGSGTFANDISLLELSEELSFNDAVQPISLPSSGQSFTGDDCVLSGINNTNIHHSPSLTEHNNNHDIYDIGYPSPDLGQAQKLLGRKHLILKNICSHD
jgi:GTP:adenosylcobinamide-phosphate guanylyltransferase